MRDLATSKVAQVLFLHPLIVREREVFLLRVAVPTTREGTGGLIGLESGVVCQLATGV